MNVLETDWWTLALPPEFWAETEEESILIGDRDEVGCVEITTLLRDEGAFEGAEVRALALEELPQVAEWAAVTLGDYAGWRGSFEEDQAAIRSWFVAGEDQLLFITYSCDLDNAGMDDAAIDDMLGTLLLKEVKAEKPV